ncbi:hypothetical protein [Brasilonema octagenarum]|uniref:Uncharacterized protein n=1 Tax=Brasilonema octagenarum UFV-OR1 TaxID=417115 RepID=A0ABX1MJ35_9CYAN|nr:hypothetical protein [Brasilonema octagenarum]NMF66774.1 hypothetical protein [Brasilonema octagenarum UFV-OR1]
MDGEVEGDVVGVVPVGVLAELGVRVFFTVPVFFFLVVEGLVVVLGLVVAPEVGVGDVVVAGEDIVPCACTAGAVRATGAATTRDRSKAFVILFM